MSVVVATAYMDEAQGFDWLVAMDAGRILATGTPAELLEQTASTSLEQAFVALLPEERKRGHAPVVIPPLDVDENDIAIEAKNLVLRFGDFVAVKDVSFRIRRGEIFGFLGSNGCGKTTTMKMLTGLLPASEGQAWLFGSEVSPKDIETRRRVGYMTQAFSLYSELTVRQNLVLHARLFAVPEEQIPARVEEMIQRFGLADAVDSLPSNMPLGMRQRLSLAVAMVHKPELLILDEPTSGVDPVARDAFWQLLIELSRKDGVTIFLSTHFMNEAERCDRMSMMHAGVVLTAMSRQSWWKNAVLRIWRRPFSATCWRPGPEPISRSRSCPPHRWWSRGKPLHHAASASACNACSATCGAKLWSCSVTRSAPPWRWPGRSC